MSKLFIEPNGSDKYAAQTQSSPGIAVFVSSASDKLQWVKASRCFNRSTLQATALGMRNALLNQPVEVTASRPEFTSCSGNRKDICQH